MKRKILLGSVLVLLGGLIHGQKAPKLQKTTAYAITGLQKGSSIWTEVRLVDIITGDEVKQVYKSTGETEILNARTGKPVVKKLPEDNSFNREVARKAPVVTITDDRQVFTVSTSGASTLKGQNTAAPVMIETPIIIKEGINRKVVINKRAEFRVDTDKPFATNSAAMAYDKKHERLYYTPMGINQLRYIDLKSGKIFYFEEEPFGALKSPHDIPNQITRMVIASDGNGYALTNDANHLIRFTTGKKPTITDLGALTDATGSKLSIHSGGGYGGDMIADANNNLYLVTANRQVYRVSLENKLATYLGGIKGLPGGFSTNGAIAEGGSSVIVSSSSNTQGYYRFDLNTLDAEKVSTGTAVYNASDLANATLAFSKEKKKHDLKPPPPPLPEQPLVNEEKNIPKQTMEQGSIALYPNPVRINSTVRLSFANQPAGRYQVQLYDISGKLVNAREVNITSASQVEELRLPKAIAKGSYLVKIVNAKNNISASSTLVVGE